ncbi:hypothetical protein [Sulfurospirillum cavolei]|uniref:hypothetical protein n=1 Tax=Sulfurospirillum cavolei TaxID=366522 RepID=UPI000764B31A|nr:hypothetical protein [Sulfurospirillum cavolei]
MKYAHYDKETKRILGYYDKEIHGELTRAPSIEEIKERVEALTLSEEAVKKLIETGYTDTMLLEVLGEETYAKVTARIVERESVIPTPNIEIEDAVWQEAINNAHNKVKANGTTELYDFRAQSEIVAEALATFKTAIQTAIDKTDLVALRCWKAGIEFPVEWREYTVTLRTLLASTVVVELPTMPEYPSGS